MVTLFSRHRHYTFQQEPQQIFFSKITRRLCRGLFLVRTYTRLNICGTRFKDDLVKSNQRRQLKLNLMHSSKGFVFVFPWHLSTASSIQCTDVLLYATPIEDRHDTDLRSSFLRSRCGRDRMVVGFTTACAVSTYHH